MPAYAENKEWEDPAASSGVVSGKRKCKGPEKERVNSWVKTHFGEPWNIQLDFLEEKPGCKLNGGLVNWEPEPENFEIYPYFFPSSPFTLFIHVLFISYFFQLPAAIMVIYLLWQVGKALISWNKPESGIWVKNKIHCPWTVRIDGVFHLLRSNSTQVIAHCPWRAGTELASSSIMKIQDSPCWEDRTENSRATLWKQSMAYDFDLLILFFCKWLRRYYFNVLSLTSKRFLP